MIPEVISTRPILEAMRNAFLMQVRWIEKNTKEVGEPTQKEYFIMQRRSLLEIVRQIEHELDIKPKRGGVRK